MKCRSCNEIINEYFIKSKELCRKCYSKLKYERIKKICGHCGKLKHIQTRIDKIAVCNSCYIKSKNKEICNECNKLRILVYHGICGVCYSKRNKKECKKCKQIRVIEQYSLCKSCNWVRRYKEDPVFRIKILYKHRIRSGVIRKSINYMAISDKIGPKPDGDYHIDHIFPLSAFDLTNPIHIQAAFAPENHQWLPAEENFKKSNKYDIDKFNEYLDAHLQKLSKKIS